MKYLASCILLTAAFCLGCREGDVPSPKLTTTAFNTDGAPTVEFSVPDMMCAEGCGTTVRNVLSAQPGAKEVRVDFDTKTATVVIEKGTFDADEALAALVDRQFDRSTLKSESGANPPAAENTIR